MAEFNVIVRETISTIYDAAVVEADSEEAAQAIAVTETVYVTAEEYDQCVAVFNDRVAKAKQIARLKASKRFKALPLAEKIAELRLFPTT